MTQEDVTKQELEIWRTNPVTQRVFRSLERLRMQVLNQAAAQHLSPDVNILRYNLTKATVMQEMIEKIKNGDIDKV